MTVASQPEAQEDVVVVGHMMSEAAPPEAAFALIHEASPREPRICRFCLVEEGEAGLDGQHCDDFVHPCPCRGSAKFVHLECLVRHFMARGEWHNFRCPTCRHSYEGRALRRLAEISVDQVSEKFGEGSPQVAHSFCYLAQAHAQLGNALTSRDLLKQGLSIQEKQFGEGHVATAAMLAELASACGKLGDVKKQLELLEKSLEIKEGHFGVGHINTAVTLNNLATAHSELGNLVQEKELLERSLQIKERHYGKGHVQTTAALVNLAGVYGELGDVPKAREFLEWSLEIEERHFGKGHVETAITLNNLALACGEEGDLSRMLELLSRSLAIKEQHFGPQHPELCLTLANLGMVCGALGNESTATGHCRQALHICGLPGSPRNSRRHGVVLLRAASVEVATGEEAAADVDRSVRADPAFCGLLCQSVRTLQDALGPTASSRVLALERMRMERIWTAAGRADVVQRIQRLLEPVASEPSWTPSSPPSYGPPSPPSFPPSSPSSPSSASSPSSPLLVKGL